MSAIESFIHDKLCFPFKDNPKKCVAVSSSRRSGLSMALPT